MKKQVCKNLLIAFGLTFLMAGCQDKKKEDIKEQQRPNIVFIMADDHAYQALSAYGHPVSKLAPTPNIDRIANAGIRFDNSFVTNSLCGPSRAAMLTGKFGHINGFSYNGQTFDGNQPTWPKMLKQAGYQTAVVGKWHIGHTPEGIDFDFWKILNDQGEYYNPEIITKDTTEVVEGYATDLTTDYSINWLDKQRDKSKPFALMIHHKAPHRNQMPALRHTQMYENTKFPMPETYFDDYKNRTAAAEQKMNIYRDMYEGHDLKMTVAVGSDSLRYDRWPNHFQRMTEAQRTAWNNAYRKRNDDMNAANFTEKEMAEWKYQRYVQDYCATIASVDEGVGRVLDYLEKEGLTDNTLIVYTSDQGFFVGEHGWFDKRFMYEESFRTPLLMQFPGKIKNNSVATEMVQNIDLAPTFLEYAGLPVPEDIQGVSLKGITAGEKEEDDWRKSLYYHYYEFPGFHSVKRHYGVRNERYKLIHFYNNIDEWEFYDLDKDHNETNNLINNEAYAAQIAEMKEELKRLMEFYKEPPIEEWKDVKLGRTRKVPNMIPEKKH
ncbi:sulfatase [Tamlana sp. 2201CG12-4]|uniref:sulfatase family protein n=1 Tax=Tamlana sp. 2201CG12-4 TaxID=3112582 RepID=UPI002DBFE21D|nr:sulfatase [Tamlana sp. 2201CG12-4]MEC3905732.1 sulfatase [Tamlana sp. 2201CG12-4]